MKPKKVLLLALSFCILVPAYTQEAYRNYRWGMTVQEAAGSSSQLLPVTNVTRFSDTVFDIIARHKNYVIDGRIIRPIIFNNIRNERQLYSENIAFYFENNKLTAINIYHIDINSSAISRDDVVARYGTPQRYQWNGETNNEENILELFTADNNRYIILQSISRGSGENKVLILKHLTFVDKNWIDEKLKKYFEEYNSARDNTVNRLLH